MHSIGAQGRYKIIGNQDKGGHFDKDSGHVHGLARATSGLAGSGGKRSDGKQSRSGGKLGWKHLVGSLISGGNIISTGYDGTISGMAGRQNSARETSGGMSISGWKIISAGSGRTTRVNA